MSLYSFIFFPRELDEKKLHEIISAQQYSYASLSKYTFFKEEHLDKVEDIMGNETFSGIYLTRETRSEFKGSFKNKYCYILSHYLYFKKDDIDRAKKFIECPDYDLHYPELYLETLIETRLEHHQLYEVIDKNISSGEFVEIYNEWLSEEWKDVWGPPKETRSFSLDDVLDEKKFDLDICEWKKYIINKK